MARRAAYFIDNGYSTGTGNNTLLVAGPFEFIRPGMKPPEKHVLQAMADAYGRMNYSLGGLSKKEGELFEKSNILLDNWQKVEALTKLVRTLGNGIKIGFILLPELPSGSNSPAPDLAQDIRDAAQELGKTTDLVAAISPWGYFAEKSWLDTNSTQVDLLLGAGPGAALHKLSDNGKTLWVRPNAKGKTLTRVDLEHVPAENDNRGWTNKDFTVTTTPLGDSMRPDPEVDALFTESNLNGEGE